MDLWQLHVFCRVVETKSFSKAAALVHLSQPTVSSHVQALESHFGCRLIDRLARQAVPTQAGRLLHGYARRLLSLRDEAEAALAAHQGRMRGSLIIGGSTIPGTYLLPAALGIFKKRYPDIGVSLRIADTGGIVGEILAGTLELGVVGAEVKHRGIFQEKVLNDQMKLIVPAGHPWARKKRVPLAALLKESFIVRERGSGTLQSFQESLLRSGHSLDEFNVVAEMGNTEAIRQAVKNRVGVSILSTLAVENDLATGSLRALAVDGVDLNRSFYLTYHRQRSLSPPGDAFIRVLKDHLAAR
ncbi:MAG: selenium metabolism-associated LysR family transcriptional regulator [Desulfobacterales bacterium]|jgi:DNA-binding transcriptional LysR family regulator|nr:selenium metabolism-associated LysR family transcriptional regulator [Desulfobacterales bacterium]